jgi:hypothetical protein
LDFIDGVGGPPAPQRYYLGIGGDASKSCQVTVSVQADGGWLEVSPTSVTLTSTPVEFTFSVRPGQTVGNHTGSVHVACIIDGVDWSGTTPANLAVEPHRLVPDTIGVALMKAPSRSRLTRLVSIGDALSRAAVPWTAASDQPWLTVTPAGSAPGAIQLSADPAGLPPGTTFAWVTLTSPDASVVPVERIRVGLSILDADPAPFLLPVPLGPIALSPVEPVVFMTSGSGTDVLVHDLNSGALVRSFVGVASRASSLAVSGDGTMLYLLDSTTRVVLELDATTGAVLRSIDAASYMGWPLVPTAVIHWARPGGQAVLLASGALFFDLESATNLPDQVVWSVGESQGVSWDGSAVLTGDAWLFDLRRTNYPSLGIHVVRVAGPADQASGAKACLGPDQAHIYQVGVLDQSGALSSVRDWDIEAGAYGTDSLTSSSWVREVACASSGVVAAVGFPDPDGHDLWVFAPPARTPIAALFARGTGDPGAGSPDRVAISADGTRVISHTYRMVFPPDRTDTYFVQALPPP